MTAIQPARLLNRAAVIARTGLSRSGLYRLEAEGRFPRRILLTPRHAVYVEAEIQGWIEARIKAGSAPAYVGRLNKPIEPVSIK